MEGRSRRTNRGARLMEIIEELDEEDEELLCKLSDSDRSLSEDESIGEGGRGGSTYNPSDYSSSADSDFSESEDEGRLDSQDSQELERQVRREDKQTADGGRRRGRGQRGGGAIAGIKRLRTDRPVVHRKRKAATIPQEVRMKQALEYAAENDAKFQQHQQRLLEGAAAPLVVNKRRKTGRRGGKDGDGAAVPMMGVLSNAAVVEQYGTTTLLSFRTLPPQYRASEQ